MKITRTAVKINLKKIVDLCVDVHKEILYFFFVIGGKEFSDQCRNHTKTIEKKLASYHKIALEHDRNSLRIICEPTGKYQNKLLQTARRLGFFTSYVNAEAVSKFRMIESNDQNKTDTKDPRVINTLGKLNKVITFRILDEPYLLLRKLHKMYQESEERSSSLRNMMSEILLDLYCDYSFKKDFLYSRSGQVLLKKYGCNPYKILEDGYKRFRAKMKRAVPRIRTATLERLWEDALSSCLNNQPENYILLSEQHLKDRMSEYHLVQKQKESIVDRMVDILNQFRENDPLIPPPTPQLISEKNLARLLAETGPLADFDHWRKLMRYAGLNLVTRQSGIYKGPDRISKKGRSLLRKILHAIALPLVRKRELYGPYYHKKKEQGQMPGNKAMTIVARHLLRKIYGWYRSGQPFNEQRFFNCKSKYNSMLAKAA